ncbi:MAG: hypothetical protein V3V33_06515 [Candidatus Lokiarchaeia archaeon]
MKVLQILNLVTEAAEGKDNIREGIVGSNCYGFIFKDLDTNSKAHYIISFSSHKFCGAGSCRETLKNLKRVSSFEELRSLTRGDEYDDLLLAGSLKTLVPTLQFGGYELLFKTWVFVKTPRGRVFPATIYWGQSGLSIGGWTSYDITPLTKERVFPEDLLEVINFSLFEFNEDEKGCFLDALEFALKKVPPSDFWGVLNHDIGNSYMGIKKGKPFIKEIGYCERDLETEKEIESLLGRKLRDADGELFTIRFLPGRKIYVMEFEYDYETEDKFFGNAKEILSLYKDLIKLP